MIAGLKVVGWAGGAVASSIMGALLLAQLASGQTDLVGTLGLPGALLSLTAAFLLGVKAVQAMRAPTNLDRTPRYRDISDIFTAHEAADQRRHEDIIALYDRLEESVERRHAENMAKLQRIEDLSLDRRKGAR